VNATVQAIYIMQQVSFYFNEQQNMRITGAENRGLITNAVFRWHYVE
jgi:hypothetical protein